MKDEPLVQVLHRSQRLRHQRFHLTRRQRRLDVIDQPRQIVFAILKHQKHVIQRVPLNHPQQPHDVFVSHALQYPHLAQRRQRHPISLAIHAHLLQRHDVARRLAPSLVHHPVRPLADASELFVIRQRRQRRARVAVARVTVVVRAHAARAAVRRIAIARIQRRPTDSSRRPHALGSRLVESPTGRTRRRATGRARQTRTRRRATTGRADATREGRTDARTRRARDATRARCDRRDAGAVKSNAGEINRRFFVPPRWWRCSSWARRRWGRW